VELVVALTLWISFGAFLFFPTVGAPPVFSRSAIGLCASEFVTVAVASFGRDCTAPGCASLADVAQSAASLQIPVLTALTLLAAAVYGLRVARTW